MKSNYLSFLVSLVVAIFTYSHSANATAIYCMYDSTNNEFIVVADSQVRGYSTYTGETITYVTIQKWRQLRNGALFVASGKYVMDPFNNKSIFDLAEDAVSSDMSFEEAAEAICSINIECGILKQRNDKNILFEAYLIGFVYGKPKMIYFCFPPESQIVDKRFPYSIKKELAGSIRSLCYVLGVSDAIKRVGNNIGDQPNKKDYLVSIMVKQIEEKPQKVGKPINVILIENNNTIKHNRLE